MKGGGGPAKIAGLDVGPGGQVGGGTVKDRPAVFDYGGVVGVFQRDRGVLFSHKDRQARGPVQFAERAEDFGDDEGGAT